MKPKWDEYIFKEREYMEEEVFSTSLYHPTVR
jgi:hypothetical protein